MLKRIVSLEGAMGLFALYSLFSGLAEGEDLQIFWGVMILAGLLTLAAVRRRDWKKHWQELDAIAASRRHHASSQHEGPFRGEQ